MTDEIKQTVKEYILKEFLPGEDPKNLTDTTPLVSGGILDSLAVLKLVAFLEERYGCQFQPHEVDAEFLDTAARIADFVQSRR